MLATPQDTATFHSDQRPEHRVTFWPSVYSDRSSGLRLTLCDLFADPAPNDADKPVATRRANMAAVLRAPSICRPILGMNGVTGEPRAGTAPLIYEYWSNGAPAGISTARSVLLRYEGIAKEGFEGTLAFAGQGTVRAYIISAGSGTVTEVRGKVREPVLDVDTTGLPVEIERDLGYLIADVSVKKGDRLEIYYWQLGEPWGGFAAKLIADKPENYDITISRPGGDIVRPAANWNEAWFEFLTSLRDAPILSAGFFGGEANGETLPGGAVTALKDLRINRAAGGAAQAEFEVALDSSSLGNGWRLEKTEGGLKRLVNNTTGEVLRKGLFVRANAGYRRYQPLPSGIYDTDPSAEVYPRFSGYIDDIEIDPTTDKATVLCVGIEGRLLDKTDENLPHQLGYHAAGYPFSTPRGGPVFGIAAYDGWELETAIADICYAAGVDSFNLGKSISTGPAGDFAGEHGRKLFLLTGTQQKYRGALLFAARALRDRTEKIRIERARNYGNVGPLRRDNLPDDDPYRFPPDPTGRLFDRALAIADHYGWDFGFNAEGQAILGARNNPTSFELIVSASDRQLGREKGNLSAIGGRYYRMDTSALSFDGIDDYVQIPHSTSLSVSGSGLTLEAWAQFSTFPPGGPRAVVNKEGSWQMGIDSAGVFQAAVSTESGLWAWISSDYAVPLGKPVHLALSYDSTNLHFVVDGKLVATKPNAASGNVRQGNTPVRLAARDNQPPPSGDGVADSFIACVLDDIRVWNIHRTPAEISATMSSGVDPSEARCVGNWKVSEFAGTVLRDYSPHGNHGRIYGAGLISPGILAWSKSIEGYFSRVDAFVGVGREREPGENLLAGVDLTDLRGWNSTDGHNSYAVPQGGGFYRVAIRNPISGVRNTEVLMDNRVSVVAGETFTESFLIRHDGRIDALDIHFFLGLTDTGEHHKVPARIVPAGPGVSRVTAHFTVPPRTDNIRAVNFSVLGSLTYIDVASPEFRTAAFNGGTFRVLVDRWDGSKFVPFVTAADDVTFSSHYNGPTGFYYSGITDARGDNLAARTAISLPFDRYRVAIQPYGTDPADPNPIAVHRLNGLATFEVDPMRTALPSPISTTKNALRLRPVSTEKDVRNHIIVVGSRKAVVTDSAKVQTEGDAAGVEFYVEVATDPASIYSPDAENYTGTKKMAVIVDDKVSGGDFARWLARSVLYRYTVPQDSADLSHTAIPSLELRDALHVVEEKERSVDHTLWVTGIREEWGDGTARVEIDATAYPEVPSYQPREEVDIDEIYGGQAVMNLRMGYRNLYGESLKNEDLESPDIFVPRARAAGGHLNVPMRSIGFQSRTSLPLSDPVIPETLFLSWNVSRSTPPESRDDKVNNLYKRVLVNEPYQRFWNLGGFRADSFAPTINWDFQVGDGTPGVYDMDYYAFPEHFAAETKNDTQYYLNYDYFVPREGKNPFYDPYTSEVGNLVSIKFDALVSGWYRVSIWDAVGRRTAGREVPVAWLSNPQGASEEPEEHWVYLEAGADRAYLWDGVDNIGEYNRIHSEPFAQEMAAAFEGEALAVGAGYYAWNESSTDRYTQIGDARAENYEPDGSGGYVYPYFTMGRFGRFYVKIEARPESARDMGDPRVVDSRDLNKRDIGGELMHPTKAAFVWTHLGEPSQVEMQIEDWSPQVLGPDGIPVGDYTEDSPPQGWRRIIGNTGDPETQNARIREGKPVRIQFSPKARPGVLFHGASGMPDREKTSARLVRQAHLEAITFDQFWTYFARPWEGVHQSYSTQEKEKRVTSRMYANGEHTVEWRDSGYRSGTDIARMEWIFRPSDFKADFGGGSEEVIRYGDFEQLEALPNFNPTQIGGVGGGQDRAYLTLAYMAYLFYLSAFSIDRSGRRQYCLNPTFIDRSKIVTPAWHAATAVFRGDANYRPEYAVQYERHGADRYLSRSIFVRNWVEPTWRNPGAGGQYYPGSPLHANHPGTGGYARFAATSTDHGETLPFRLQFVQPLMTSFSVTNGLMQHPRMTAPYEDIWLAEYALRMRDTVMLQETLEAEARSGRAVSDLSAYPKDHPRHSSPGRFGDWTFDRGGEEGWFAPSPKRDFRPYWTRDMPDWNSPYPQIYTNEWPDSFASRGHMSQIDATWLAANNRFQHILDMPAAQRYRSEPHRDFARPEKWLGFAVQLTFEPQKRAHAPRLEQTVSSRFEEKGRPAFGHVFDYERIDELPRYEHFRGCMSRGTITPKEIYSDFTNRRGGMRPAPATGWPYFLNLGEYEDLGVGPIGKKDPDVSIHYVSRIREFFDMRFRHEYVWQSWHYFPADGSNFMLPEFFRREYTRADEFIGRNWWQDTMKRVLWFLIPGDTVAGRTIYYDPGAWAGWKDDHPFSGLRWFAAIDRGTDLASTRPGYVPDRGIHPAPHKDTAILCGGHNEFFTGTGLEEGYFYWHGKRVRAVRANILDSAYSKTDMRLAVSRWTPESRQVVTNLVLPARLAGFTS